MSDSNKARVREFLDRVLTGGDIDATGEYFERDMVEEVPFPGQGPGLDGLKETLSRIRTGVSGFEVDRRRADCGGRQGREPVRMVRHASRRVPGHSRDAPPD